MSEKENDTSVATPFVYNSPFPSSTEPEPKHFYNAFPELNDRASDRSLTAFPRRAKYHFALDSMYIPEAIWISSRELSEIDLTEYSEDTKLTFNGAYNQIPTDFLIPFPKSLVLESRFYRHFYFETAHRILTSSPFKLSLRIRLLAPFYTTLSYTIAKNKEIRVPVRATDGRNVSRLQRHLLALKSAFNSTILLDESYSLFFGSLDYETDHKRMKSWIIQMDGEIKGFRDFYNEISKDLTNIMDDLSEWHHFSGEDDVMYNSHKLGLILMTLTDIFKYKYYSDSSPSFNDRVPKMWDITELFQYEIAQRENKEEKMLRSYLRGKGEQPPFHHEYFYITAENYENSTFLHVIPGIKTLDVISHLYKELSQIDRSKETQYNASLPPLLQSYDILFTEAMRQQICTGVGLLCPFWTGENCCEYQRSTLQKIYKKTVPESDWKYWKKPPCLE
jgi:hypothetical protein